MRTGDIGSAGENYFRAWCEAVGITANPSAEDMHGWDILIEIDTQNNLANPVSMHHGIVESKIQIKSTDSKNKHVSVELSNLRKMATSTLPCFYMLICFDGKEAPAKVYIRHVDSELISQTLSRIANLVNKDSKIKLNKHKMRVNFTEEISPLTPSELKMSIKKYLCDSQSSYVKTKQRYLESAGYADGGYKLKFSLNDYGQLNKLIEASLGRLTDVRVEEVQGTVTRFGFSTVIESLTASSAVLSFLDILPDAKGEICFRKISTGKSYKFKAKIYRSGLNNILPVTQRKIRMASSFFDVYLSGNQKLVIHVSMKADVHFEADEILKGYEALHILRDPGDVEFGMFFYNLPATVRFVESDDFEDCSYKASVMKKVVELKRCFEWDNPFMVSLQEVQDNVELIDKFHKLILNQEEPMSIFYTRGEGPPVGEEVDCFYVIHLYLGGYLFVDLMVARGLIESSSDGFDKLNSITRKSIYRAIHEVNYLDRVELKNTLSSIIDAYVSDRIIFNCLPLFVIKVLGVDFSSELPALSSSIN